MILFSRLNFVTLPKLNKNITPKDTMPRKEHTSLPDHYPVCEHGDCVMAATCLHQNAYTEKVQQDDFLLLINPTRCSKDAECRFYRDNRPVTYARGFTGFQKRMFPDQYSRFMAVCISHWSRNTYFERRRGDRLLPPDEQVFILNALREAGVTEALKFDHYEECINWCD